MKDRDLEVLLLAARTRKAGEYSPFTQAVMSRIKRGQTVHRVLSGQKRGGWHNFLRFLRLHKLVTAIAAIIILTVTSFSGYAYATGTDPVTLIKEIKELIVKREVVGNEVRATYDGREFRYDKSVAYSDIAITAFAELNAIDLLAFHADNAFTIPRDGVEHVTDPFNTQYNHPWIGVIERVDGESVAIRKQYMAGNIKAGDRSRHYDELVTLPGSDVSLFVEGVPADTSASAVGQLVQVYQRYYIRHWSRSDKQPAHVSHYFAFALKHSLAEIQAMRETTERAFAEQDLLPIYETYSGGLTDICMNNGADRCNVKTLTGGGGVSLYVAQGSYGYARGNPDVIAFGEMVGPGEEQPAGIIQRHVDGTITKITNKGLTIKTSSGASWTLEYSAAQQEAFNRRASRPLQVGNRLIASILESVYNLDNRFIDSSHIYEIIRY